MIRFGSLLLPLLWLAWGCGTKKPVPDAASKAVDTTTLRDWYFLADLHYIQGNWKQADSLFKRYIRSGLPPGPAYHRLACIASKNGRTEEALALNAKARLADTSVEEWIWLDAELYRRKSEYKKAGDVFSAYTLKKSRAWTAYTDAARCYALGGEWTAMLELCNRWENEFGLMEPIVEYKAQALTMMDRPIKAAEQWAALSRKYPDRRNYRYNQINTLFQGGAKESASRLLDTLISKDPNDFKLQTLYCELMDNSSEETIPSYLIQIAKTKAISFESKWECLESYNSPTHPAYDSCMPLLRELLLSHPKEPKVLNALGLWYLFHGNATDANRLLKQSLQEGQQTLGLWQQYLTSLSLGCDTEKLLQESDTLVELYAMIPISYQMKAIAAYSHGNADEALLFCSQGEKFAENTSALFALKSYIQIQTGKSTEKPQLAYYLKDSSIITDALMVNAVWAISQNRLDEATIMLNALFNQPEILKQIRFSGFNKDEYWSFFQCVLQRARLALLTQKNQDEAMMLLKKYLPENPVALELLGDLHTTKAEDALKYYEKAIQCTSFSGKDRVQQKINKLKYR